MSSTQENFDVDLSQAGLLGNDFLKELNQLRELDPIHWSEASGCWLVTRHEDIIDAFRDDFPLTLDRLPRIAFANVPERERVRKYPFLNQYISSWIINTDPPQHTRLRRLLMKAFNKRVVESVRPYVQSRVTELIETMKAKPELEFNETIARQLPGSVMLAMIGLPQSNLLRLKAWANAFVEAIGVPFATEEMLHDVDNAIREINEMLEPELEERRRNPRDDLLTALVQASDQGHKLTVEEMLGALHILIVAGHDSTANTLTLSLAALSQQPQAWKYMHDNPDKIMACCLELMRYVAMSASQPRIVAEDFEWHGKQLKKDEVIFLMMAAGNRDPRVYEDPETLDLTRTNDQSLVFGPGVHHCIGHVLAKMQVTEFFSALVREFQGAQVLDDRLKFMHQLAFRGLSELNVRMMPRA
ncbi:MAG: cytochrome P450 [Halieaceae bacterium]|nr:cytochrome P450 [Halieaceae bacterium]